MVGEEEEEGDMELREQESMRTRKMGRNEALGETGKLRDRERWRNTESGARKCQETEKNRGHP